MQGMSRTWHEFPCRVVYNEERPDGRAQRTGLVCIGCAEGGRLISQDEDGRKLLGRQLLKALPAHQLPFHLNGKEGLDTCRWVQSSPSLLNTCLVSFLQALFAACIRPMPDTASFQN